MKFPFKTFTPNADWLLFPWLAHRSNITTLYLVEKTSSFPFIYNKVIYNLIESIAQEIYVCKCNSFRWILFALTHIVGNANAYKLKKIRTKLSENTWKLLKQRGLSLNFQNTLFPCESMIFFHRKKELRTCFASTNTFFRHNLIFTLALVKANDIRKKPLHVWYKRKS